MKTKWRLCGMRKWLKEKLARSARRSRAINGAVKTHRQKMCGMSDRMDAR